MNTFTMFEAYFAKHLAKNPYYDEIIDLLRNQTAHTTTKCSDTCVLSLEEGINATELLDYRISTMTCIYDFQVELDE